MEAPRSGVIYHRASKTESRRDFLRQMGALWLGFFAQAGVNGAAQIARSNSARAAHDAAPCPLAQLAPPREPAVDALIAINQVGFLPEEPKRAVIAAMEPIPGDGFFLIDDGPTPRIRFHAALKPYRTDHDEGQGHYPYHFYAEFDHFRQAGRYRVRLSDGRASLPFSIGKDLYNPLIPLMLQFFTVQSCSLECGNVHGRCHRDDGVILGGPRAGQTMDGAGGWHDAGDYLKFVETTSYVTALMLFTCDLFPHLLQHKVPTAKLPPLLEQARVGLEWLLKMHPAPDEFYYQVGDASDHDRWRLPDEDCQKCDKEWKPRPVYFGVGANLAGRTAAALALAARLFPRYDQPFAQRCLQAAQSVYQLGLNNRTILSTEPSDFYPESTWEDDMEWGAVELFRATGKADYLQQALEFAHQAKAAGDPISVYNTHALAHFSLYPFAPESDQARLQDYLAADAVHARTLAENPYGLATSYTWGTAQAAAGAALNCLLSARISAENKNANLDVARYNRDFILGCNPCNISNLIGAGTNYPRHPHHQIANLKQIELTGALVGGPTSPRTFNSQKIALDKLQLAMIAGPPVPPDLPDYVAVYHDSVQDYVTNEPAIDYTATFLLLAAFYHQHQ